MSENMGDEARTEARARAPGSSGLSPARGAEGQIHAVENTCKILEARLDDVGIAINRLWQVWRALYLEPDAKEIKDHLVKAMNGLWDLEKRLSIQLERERAKLHKLRAQLEVISA